MKLPLNKVLCGDNRKVMKTLPNDSIDLIATSPPYWGLRDYGTEPQIWGGKMDCTHDWLSTPPPRKKNLVDIKDQNSKQATMRGSSYDAPEGSKCVNCGAWMGQLGLEPHPQMFIDNLVEIFREVKRILKPSGSFWLNLGDSYYSNPSNKQGPKVGARGSNREPRRNNRNLKSNWLQPKQKLMIPARVAIALQDEGWILRNDVIWFKPNHMPESVQDRLTKSYEDLFFFVKNNRYHFNLDPIRKPQSEATIKRITQPNIMNQKGGEKQHELYGDQAGHGNRPVDITKGMASKYANREDSNALGSPRARAGLREVNDGNLKGKNPGDVWEINTYPFKGAHFAVFPPKLIEPIIKAACPEKGVFLDPFAGSGTALRVARSLGRSFIGIELNPENAIMCEQRVRAEKYTPPPEGVPKLKELFENVH